MSERVQCPICQDYFKIPTEPNHDFVTFPCRHGTCRTCLREIYRRAKKSTEADCPVCRQTFNRNAAHHLYLTFERASIATAITTTERLGEMNANSKLISVRNAGEHVRKASESLECKDGEVATSLIKAVEDFKERIVPVFEAQEAQMQELARLRAQLEEAKRDVSKAKVIAAQCRQKDSEIESLRKQLTDVRQSRSEASAESRSLGAEVQRLRVENEQLAESGSKLEESSIILKGLLEEHKRTNRSQKVKIKLLKEKNRDLLAQLEGQNRLDVEESLVIGDDNQAEPLQQTRTQTRLSASPSTPTLNPALPSPSSSPNRDKENAHCEPLFDYEGLPRPGFKSDWSMGGVSVSTNSLKRKNSTTRHAGISLDRKGQPVGAIQLGPKRSRRAV